MRLSPTIILLLQSALISLQMINTAVATGIEGMRIHPLISILLAAFVGGFQFFVNHLGNQLLPAQKAATPPRVALIVGLILLGALALPAPASAETTAQGLTFGMAYNQNGSPQLMVWGTYDRQLSDKIYSYSGYDVTPIDSLVIDGKFRVPQLKYTAFSGFAIHAATIDKVTLWLYGAAGLATTGETMTGSGNYGGFAHVILKGNWGLILGAQGSYSPIAGTDAIIRLGFRYGVK
jgi:hypothetical protein